MISHLTRKALPDAENKAVVEILAARVPSEIQFDMLGHSQRHVIVCCASIKCPPISWRPVWIDVVQVKEFVMDTNGVRKAAV